MSGAILPETRRSLERKCLDLANHLASQYALSTSTFKDISEINSELIVSLFEKVTKQNIPDLLFCENKEDEAHNIQAVIDTLSLDLLGISLSHITGDAIVSGNCRAILNLLEIFEGVSLYIPSKENREYQSDRSVKRKICKKNKSSTKAALLESRDITPVSSAKSVQSTDHSIARSKQSSSFSSASDLKVSSSISSHECLDKSNAIKKGAFIRETIPGRDRHTSTENVSDIKRSTRLRSSGSRNHATKTKSQLHSQKNDKSSTSQLNKAVPTPKSIETARESHSTVQKDSSKKYFSLQNTSVSESEKLKREISQISCSKQKSVCAVTNTNEIEDLLEANLESKVKVILEKNSCHRFRVSHMKKMQLQAIKKPFQRKPVSPCKKSFLLPYSLRHHSISRTNFRRITPQKRHSSPYLKLRKVGGEQSNLGFIQELLQEFSGLQHSTAILNHISKKYRQHLMRIHKQIRSCVLNKPKIQLQAEEAAKRQLLISNLLKKDVQQERYMKELEEKKMYESKMKYHLRDARLQSAKMKQYSNEFHSEMRKKMQKRNFSEELALETLFKDALGKQKEQVDMLCLEVKEAGENDARRHLAYLDALENLYQSQYSMISEALNSEKKKAREQSKVERQETDLMRRKFQEELKKEIRFMQNVIVQSTEDIHFTELRV